MYPIINILSYSIPSEKFCASLGFVIALIAAVIMGKFAKTDYKRIIFGVISVVVGAVVGGAVIYAAVNYTAAIKLFEELPNMGFKAILSGVFGLFKGSVFYGEFFGALIGLGIHTAGYERKAKKKAFDIFAVCLPLYHCVSRIGCFLGGRCYGIAGKFGINVNGQSLLPVALLEAYFNILIFLLLHNAFKKSKLRGRLVYAYMFLYSIARFGVEFLRGDQERGIWFGFSTSQWISAVLFVITFFYFLFTVSSTFKDIFAKGDATLPTDKNIFKTIVLWVLTFGIYGFVVMTSVSKNINITASKYDKKRTMNYCLLAFLVGWLTFGIGFIVWGYRLTKRVANELTRRNIDYLFTKNDFWLWNFAGLMILAGPFVYLHKLFRAVNLINKDYNEKGE